MGALSVRKKEEQTFEQGIECRMQIAAWDRCDELRISGSQLRLRAADVRFARLPGSEMIKP
jgi:hypothetical protein